MPENYIRTDEAIVQLLDKMLEVQQTQTQQIINNTNLIKQQTPAGIVEPLHTVTVTTTQKVIKPPTKPWFSVSIINDGDNTCYVIVNQEKASTTPYELRKNETYEIDFGTPNINEIVVYTMTGTASLRIKGVR